MPAPATPVPDDATFEEIFSTRGPFDLSRVLHLISSLDGITGCTALFGRDIRFAGTVPEDFDAREFRDNVWDAFLSISAMTRGIGIGDPAAVTLNTGRHICSLFTAGEAALLVFHQEHGFQPGVREKIQAATAGLARMI
jgi:hypothetical protein